MSWGNRTHFAPITTDHTLVPGVDDTEGIPFVFNADCLPNEMLDADGPNPSKSDFGDVQIASNLDGTGRWSIEKVTYTQDNNPASAVAEIWARDATAVWFPSAVVDEDICIGWGDASESQPAVGASYGRNEVWNEYDGVFHLEESANTTSGGYLDSTGNGNDGTGQGDIASAIGKIGNSWQGDGDNQTGCVQTGITTQYSSFSLSLWLNRTGATQAYQRALDKKFDTGVWIGRDNVTNNYGIGIKSAGINQFASITSSGWHYFMATRSGTTLHGYYDGTHPINGVTVNGTTLDSTPLRIGDSHTLNDEWQGLLDEVRASSAVFSNDRATIEYNSQDDPGTFWTPGAPKVIGSSSSSSSESSSSGSSSSSDSSASGSSSGSSSSSSSSTPQNCYERVGVVPYEGELNDPANIIAQYTTCVACEEGGSSSESVSCFEDCQQTPTNTPSHPGVVICFTRPGDADGDTFPSNPAYVDEGSYHSWTWEGDNSTVGFDTLEIRCDKATGEVAAVIVNSGTSYDWGGNDSIWTGFKVITGSVTCGGDGNLSGSFNLDALFAPCSGSGAFVTITL